MTTARRRLPSVVLALAIAAPTFGRAATATAQPAPAPPATGSPPSPAPAPPPIYSAPPPMAPPPPGTPPASPWAAPYAPPQDQPRDAWGAPLPPSAAPPPMAAPGQAIYVELRSDNPHARIDRVVDGARMPVCTTPCRMYLRTDQVYVIEGDGIQSTSRFELPTDRAAVTLDVKAGSSNRTMGGALLTGGGGVLAYIGLLVLESSFVANTDTGTTSHDSNLTYAGLGLMAGGVILGITGIVILTSSHTTVTSSTGSVFTQNEDDAHHARPAPRRRWVALTPRGLEF